MSATLFGAGSSWVPCTDVRETAKDWQFLIEVPGVSQDKLSVEAHDNLLTISGCRGGAKDKALGNLLLNERRGNNFSRSFVLPPSAQLNKTEAQLDNGLLTLRVPKAEPSQHIVQITRRRIAQAQERKTEPSQPVAERSTRRGAQLRSQLQSVYVSSPQLLPIAAQLSGILRRLRSLQRQGGYSLRDVTQLQEELHEIDMRRGEDGTFGGRPDYAGTGAREALVISLLHKAHRFASSLLASTEVHASLEPLQRELEDIETKLEALACEPPAGIQYDNELHKLQEQLDAIDAKRKDAAFPGPQGEPVHGQAFLHNLLEHCYDLVSELQIPSAHAGEVDPQLRQLHAFLKQKVAMLEALRRKPMALESELRTIRESLVEVERNRIAGVFGGAPSAPPPRGQAVLSSLLHRAYRLLHILEVSATESED